MTGRRRALAAMAPALVAMAVALVAGCGITPTGVTDGGEPAIGFRPSTRLYFVSGSHLQVVTRPIPWPPLKETIGLLLDGPTAAERKRGIDSELTPDYTPTKVTASQAKVRISLPLPKQAAAPQDTRPMPTAVPQDTRPMPTAVPQDTRPILWIGQLTCTAASALAARSNIDPDAITVVITLGGQSVGSFRCSQFPRGSQ
ncbi:hypothetical protein AB0O34_22190 [Sphaerisporangium sp. NPDC088356]|uniref:hypothetical protein n=1 Tax=Sphaerisporangium sp. NPDC088356 TaxID=3154871 RepID=UPI00341A7785